MTSEHPRPEGGAAPVDAAPNRRTDHTAAPTPADEPQAGTPAADPRRAAPQAPAALGGMGSTGPITVVRKKS